MGQEIPQKYLHLPRISPRIAVFDAQPPLRSFRYDDLNIQHPTGPALAKTESRRGGSTSGAIDDTDFRLIALLRRDGRMSTRELARALGLTEATVRARLRRLEETQTMRVVAMTDYRLAGFNLIASIGVQVKGRDAGAIAEDIARLPQVLDVQIVIGACDIEISVAAGERDQLALLLQEVAKIEGVSRLNAGMALDVYKFQWGWVPFLDDRQLTPIIPDFIPLKSLELDTLDRQIIDRLAQDARISNRAIGRELAVTEGTIRTRIKRLLDDKIIRITAIANVDRLTKPLVALLWIDVEHSADVPRVAAALATQTQISYVATMLGRCDAMAVALVEDGEQLIAYIHQTIDRIAGVHQVRYTLVHQFVKHDYRWTMIIQD
jgi:Lrp/AsnC family transcriptional regulator for asnA, asnC and gidA